jgi:hypothetical protein
VATQPYPTMPTLYFFMTLTQDSVVLCDAGMARTFPPIVKG